MAFGTKMFNNQIGGMVSSSSSSVICWTRSVPALLASSSTHAGLLFYPCWPPLLQVSMGSSVRHGKNATTLVGPCGPPLSTVMVSTHASSSMRLFTGPLFLPFLLCLSIPLVTMHSPWVSSYLSCRQTTSFSLPKFSNVFYGWTNSKGWDHSECCPTPVLDQREWDSGFFCGLWCIHNLFNVVVTIVTVNLSQPFSYFSTTYMGAVNVLANYITNGVTSKTMCNFGWLTVAHFWCA